MISDCGLHDLGIQGSYFTWKRYRGTKEWIQEKLDRGLATGLWRKLYQNAEVRSLDTSSSDHLPFLLITQPCFYVPKSRVFRFENVWLKERDCRAVVERSWAASAGCELQYKIASCALELEK